MLEYVHPKWTCEGTPCTFHNPSEHHMRDWHMTIRYDRYDLLTERLCPHDIGHPDPDSLGFIELAMGREERLLSGVHGCDGCCRE